ncbi:MAG: D-alanyl-D-alanine carboxypeptidase family protein [Lachnospiraceae bacterium]
MVKKSYDDVCRVMNDSLNENHNLDTIHAKYALLMDSENGRILYEKEGFTKVPMASTTKIMTLIVALENSNLDDLVTVSTNAAAQPDVQLNIKAEEQYRLKDLLYSLMLESHNDVAVAIAEHVGGSVEGFASMMNQKAKEIGAYDTHFVTPNGLDADNHYTTAKDLALIAKYCIENKMFCEIIQTKTYSFHEQTTGRAFTVNNKNRFLDSYEGAFGIKTGFTGKAGYCFVGAAKRDNKSFISVVLASGWPPHKLYKWNDTIRLMDYGMSNFHKKVIVEKNVSFQKVKVDNGIHCSDVTPCTKESVSLLVNDSESITYDVCLPKRLEAPIKNKQKIGTLTIKINNEIYKKIPLYSDKACEKITYGFCMKYILYQFFCHGSKVDFLAF